MIAVGRIGRRDHRLDRDRRGRIEIEVAVADLPCRPRKPGLRAIALEIRRRAARGCRSSGEPATKASVRWPRSIRCAVARRRRALLVHIDIDAALAATVPDPGASDVAASASSAASRGLSLCGGVRMTPSGRSADRIAPSSATALSGVGIDQFEHQMITVALAFGHAAEQHLVDPVIAATGLPILERALAIVDREDQIGSCPAHPPRAEIGNIAQFLDRLLDSARAPLP